MSGRWKESKNRHVRLFISWFAIALFAPYLTSLRTGESLEGGMRERDVTVPIKLRTRSYDSGTEAAAFRNRSIIRRKFGGEAVDVNRGRHPRRGDRR
jgi:hypothetical protein